MRAFAKKTKRANGFYILITATFFCCKQTTATTWTSCFTTRIVFFIVTMVMWTVMTATRLNSYINTLIKTLSVFILHWLSPPIYILCKILKRDFLIKWQLVIIFTLLKNIVKPNFIKAKGVANRYTFLNLIFCFIFFFFQITP